MLVLIEGPDCVGKSTLAAELVRHFSTHYQHARVELLHRGPPRSHPLDEYELPLVDYRPNGAEHHVVCDRWHLGELVYPVVLDRPTALTEPVLRHVELFLRARGALLVAVNASAERVRDCVADRGDDLVSVDQSDALRVGFLDAFDRTALPSVHVDATDVSCRTTLNTILSEADLNAYTHEPLAKFVTYVGPRWPKLLLLGDVRARPEPNDLRPAFMPYPATSGHYLLDVLGDAARLDVGIANACDVDDPKELHSILGSPVTVTLGRNAERAAPWAHRAVPHPQWQRRFQHHQYADYRHAILGV